MGGAGGVAGYETTTGGFQATTVIQRGWALRARETGAQRSGTASYVGMKPAKEKTQKGLKKAVLVAPERAD